MYCTGLRIHFRFWPARERSHFGRHVMRLESKPKSKQSNQVLAAAAAAALASVVVAPAARAADATRDGGGGNASWTTPGNWAGDAAPVAGDNLRFGGATNLAPSNDFATNTSFSGISFLAGAGSFALSGNAAVVTGDISNNSGVAQSINLAT